MIPHRLAFACDGGGDPGAGRLPERSTVGRVSKLRLANRNPAAGLSGAVASGSMVQGRGGRTIGLDHRLGKGEAGNDQPMSTRRTFPPGRPPEFRPTSPLRHLRTAGLPGQRASSAFPRPWRGAGAEGVG